MNVTSIDRNMAARSIHQWFAEYGESHQHPTNTLIHWICVPAIFLSIVGLLYSVPVAGLMTGSVAIAVAVLVLLFYIRLGSTPILIGMAAWCCFCLLLCDRAMHHAPWPLWAICVAVFAAAWIGQFYGHHIEGRKPSFLKDVQFLLIGPAWLMGKLYRRLGIAY